MSTLRNAIQSLYGYACDQMPAEALAELSSTFHDYAVTMAMDSVTLYEGLACLIDADANAADDGKSSVGVLQNGDGIFQMLCGAAQKFDLIAGLVEVARDADYSASRRREEGNTGLPPMVSDETGGR